MTPAFAVIGAIMIAIFIGVTASGNSFDGSGLLLILGIAFVIGGLTGGISYIVKHRN